MGWRIPITSDKDITDQDVERALKLMPAALRQGVFPDVSRQAWGWSGAVDISNPKGKHIDLAGSFGISGQIAEQFAKEFAKRLRKDGHKVRIGRVR